MVIREEIGGINIQLAENNPIPTMDRQLPNNADTEYLREIDRMHLIPSIS